MTKTIIIGQPEEAKKELKKIEFVSFLGVSGLDSPAYHPRDFDFIELISIAEITRMNTYSKDLMFAYNNGDRPNGKLYLGHWNDGVV